MHNDYVKEIEYGFCQCGCGGLAPLAKQNHTKFGYVKGQPIRFIFGHQCRNMSKEKSPSWRGGISTKCDHGYIGIHLPEHPRARPNGYVLEHILIAERVLGKPLSDGVIIHHIDEDKANNSNNNLVICESRNYHNLIHRRKKALINCGHADWLWCSYCKNYGQKEGFYIYDTGTMYHKTCKAEYNKRRKEVPYDR